ncbi:MAG: hypothetical protein Fur002_04640 [Anaerolineales bacterium]
MRRSQLFWGVALLLLGGLMFAGQMGIKLPNGDSPTEIFFPLALLLAGAWILLGAFFRGKIETIEAFIDLQGGTSAKIKLDHGAGELKLHGGASGAELLRGSFMGGLDSKTKLDGDHLEVKMRPAQDAVSFPFGGKIQLDWDVALNPQIPLDLEFNLGANKATLDLRDLSIKHLNLDTGASETMIYFPARGRFSADVDCGAASLEMTIPAELSARIRATVVAGDLNLDKARFPRNGAYYQSPDFDSAPNVVDISIDAGAASVKIK